MSHLCTGEAREFASIKDIVSAAYALGWSVRYGKQVRYYAGDGPACDVVIEFSDDETNGRHKLNEKYNIGFQKLQNGHYQAVYDNAMDGRAVRPSSEIDAVTKRVMGKFKQAYYAAGIKRQAANTRRSVQKQVMPGGVVRLRVQY